MTLLREFNKALKGKDTEQVDGAAIALGKKLAKAIDEGEGDIDRVSSRMLAVLIELQMTPKSRNKATTDEQPKANPLDELKAKRNARVSKA